MDVVLFLRKKLSILSGRHRPHSRALFLPTLLVKQILIIYFDKVVSKNSCNTQKNRINGEIKRHFRANASLYFLSLVIIVSWRFSFLIKNVKGVLNYIAVSLKNEKVELKLCNTKIDNRKKSVDSEIRVFYHKEYSY